MEKVSLILTTYNSRNNLETTLESVLAQDYPSLEVVICDGGSTDGTIEIIKKYEERMRIKWISEKDSGIYDAMNKGYSMATGEILSFFNDIYCRNDAVSLCVKAMNRNNCEGAHADLVYMNGELVVRQWKMGEGKIEQGWMPGHPTLFLRREVYEKFGLYKTDYRISADYEFMIRILKNNEVRLAYVPETIITMYYGGASTRGLKGYLISLREGHRALKENRVKHAILIDVRRTLKVLKQFRR